MTTSPGPDYAARLDIVYPDRQLDRLSSAFRIIWVIPVVIIVWFVNGTGIQSETTGSGVSGGALLVCATVLMILFRQKYPRWWFDFQLELTRFSTRVLAYFALMSDEYPSTTDEQFVHLELDYPDVKQDLNRWLPLVKWILAIPHYIVLLVLAIGALFAGIAAWFAILFTGRYPRGIFDYIEGLMRWGLRVEAYSVLMLTDEYPPFSLK